MELVKAIGREALGLFVADASLVAGVLIWAIAIAFALRLGLIGPAIAAVSIAVGVAALLVFDVYRARRPRQTS